MDTINRDVLNRVRDSIETEVPSDAELHTVTITLNGAHGGVDVTASYYVDGMAFDDFDKTWVVR